MNKRERAIYVLDKMEELFPNSATELKNWKTPFQFLICIILSAQTTDAQVNKVTSILFEAYPTSKQLKSADLESVEQIIRSINYYKTKSRHIIKAAEMIEDQFNGDVPKRVEELVKIPGVGLKTANVFLNDLYKANQGVAVDTHVLRVAQRLGFTKNTDPNKVAIDLQKLYPKKDWYRINLLFVLYGRYICKARVKPEESKCIFKDFCSHCGVSS